MAHAPFRHLLKHLERRSNLTISFTERKFEKCSTGTAPKWSNHLSWRGYIFLMVFLYVWDESSRLITSSMFSLVLAALGLPLTESVFINTSLRPTSLYYLLGNSLRKRFALQF